MASSVNYRRAKTPNSASSSTIKEASSRRRKGSAEASSSAHTGQPVAPQRTTSISPSSTLVLDPASLGMIAVALNEIDFAESLNSGVTPGPNGQWLEHFWQINSADFQQYFSLRNLEWTADDYYNLAFIVSKKCQHILHHHYASDLIGTTMETEFTDLLKLLMTISQQDESLTPERSAAILDWLNDIKTEVMQSFVGNDGDAFNHQDANAAAQAIIAERPVESIVNLAKLEHNHAADSQTLIAMVNDFFVERHQQAISQKLLKSGTAWKRFIESPECAWQAVLRYLSGDQLRKLVKTDSTMLHYRPKHDSNINNDTLTHYIMRYAQPEAIVELFKKLPKTLHSAFSSNRKSKFLNSDGLNPAQYLCLNEQSSTLFKLLSEDKKLSRYILKKKIPSPKKMPFWQYALYSTPRSAKDFVPLKAYDSLKKIKGLGVSLGRLDIPEIHSPYQTVIAKLTTLLLLIDRAQAWCSVKKQDTNADALNTEKSVLQDLMAILENPHQLDADTLIATLDSFKQNYENSDSSHSALTFVGLSASFVIELIDDVRGQLSAMVEETNSSETSFTADAQYASDAEDTEESQLDDTDYDYNIGSDSSCLADLEYDSDSDDNMSVSDAGLLGRHSSLFKDSENAKASDFKSRKRADKSNRMGSDDRDMNDDDTTDRSYTGGPSKK